MTQQPPAEARMSRDVMVVDLQFPWSRLWRVLRGGAVL